MSIVYLSLGGNIGDVEQNFIKALNLLNSADGCEVLSVSSIYKTKPVGLVEQPDFLNICVKLYTKMQPLDTLNICKQIENELGRVRESKWGPRTIDIDILLYDNQIVNSDELAIPHSQMLERAFVLIPLAEIEPELILPSNQKVKDAAKLIGNQEVSLIKNDFWRP